MDCREIRERLLRDGIPPVGPEVDAHGDECESCATLLAGGGALAARLTPMDSTTGDVDGILRSLAGQIEAERGVSAWLRSRPTGVRRLLHPRGRDTDRGTPLLDLRSQVGLRGLSTVPHGSDRCDAGRGCAVASRDSHATPSPTTALVPRIRRLRGARRGRRFRDRHPSRRARADSGCARNTTVLSRGLGARSSCPRHSYRTSPTCVDWWRALVFGVRRAYLQPRGPTHVFSCRSRSPCSRACDRRPHVCPTDTWPCGVAPKYLASRVTTASRARTVVGLRLL